VLALELKRFDGANLAANKPVPNAPNSSISSPMRSGVKIEKASDVRKRQSYKSSCDLTSCFAIPFVRANLL
jgi:hypothetical protein